VLAYVLLALVATLGAQMPTLIVLHTFTIAAGASPHGWAGDESSFRRYDGLIPRLRPTLELASHYAE
jgi:hypothetical protein